MDEPLDELYLEWLYRQVSSVRLKNPNRTYWSLIKHFFSKEFVWFVPNDDNRVEDGRDLRHEFLEECEIENPDPEWLELGCSFLELLIGLSRRLAFEAEGEPAGWFWQLVDNIDLRDYNDARYDDYKEKIDEAVDAVIWRTYSFDGHGGLFPLTEAHDDQREIEIWYQLSAYVLERMD